MIIRGEVIGYRFWEYESIGCDGWPTLVSCFGSHMHWPHDRPAFADGFGESQYEKYEGIHAFKKDAGRRMLHGGGGQKYIFGTVWLWGRVQDHKHGYRAEFAQVRSIEHVPIKMGGGGVQKTLRRLYGCTHRPRGNWLDSLFGEPLSLPGYYGKARELYQYPQRKE